MSNTRWPLDSLDGVIERRVLVNFRVDPTLLARLVPAPFEPVTVEFDNALLMREVKCRWKACAAPLAARVA